MNANRAVFSGLMAEDLDRGLDQDSERALAALEDVVDLRAGRRCRVILGADLAHRRHVLLADHQVVGVAVVGGRLSGAQRGDPAADRGHLIGLREVAAGERPVAAEQPRCVVEQLLEVGAHETRLHGRGHVALVDAQQLVHVSAHHQHHTAAFGAVAQDHAGAGAVGQQRDVILDAIRDDRLDVFLVARMDHQIRSLLDLACAQGDVLVEGLAVAVAHPIEVRVADVLRPHDRGQGVAMDGIQTGAAFQRHRVIALTDRSGEVGIGHAELILEHGDPARAWVFDPRRVEAEGVPVSAFACQCLAPRGADLVLGAHRDPPWLRHPHCYTIALNVTSR
ncbi:MAG: hypothetical protein V9E82_04880 [Candidatus Nanopelagicales bacterium]